MSRSIHDGDLHEDEPTAEGLSRATLATIVAVIVVLAALGGAIFYFSTEGSVTGVTLTEPSRNEDLLTFAFTISTDHGYASGGALFSAVYNDTVVYTRAVPVEAGAGRVDVHFRDFVFGNGNYTFHLTYKGVTGTTSYAIGIEDHTEFIVTAIRVDAGLVYPDDGKIGAIGVTIHFLSDLGKLRYAAAPPGANITYRVLKNGISQDAAAIERTVAGRTTLAFNYTPTLGLGNYTIEVTYHNAWVNSTSPIVMLMATNATYLHNRPTACTTAQTYHGTSSNSTVTVDGSCSSDDGAIVQYTWEFGDGSSPVTSGSSPIETHTFPSQGGRTYTGTLTVQDNGPGILAQDASSMFTVQITFF
jgi:hypothetical protein